MKTFKKLLLLAMLLIAVGLCAQTTLPSPALTVIPDSLVELREQQIEEEYGFNENSTLADVCTHLKADIHRMKEQLNLEADNSKLDDQKLSRLGIGVYDIILAKETLDFGFNEVSTLSEIAKFHSLPIKKLKHLLGLDQNDKSLNGKSLQALDKSIEDVNKARTEFKESLYSMGANITLVGMLVVFAALFLTNVIILQLRHLNKDSAPKDKTPVIKLGSDGTVKSVSSEVSNNDIVAVITALHIYTHSVEERRRLMLTFQRTSGNYWHAAKLSSMPNSEYKRRH